MEKRKSTDSRGNKIMNIKEAQAITHTLSKPGKMPGFAYSIPAHECKTGTKLRGVVNSTCFKCYAYMRGRYIFNNVIDAQYKRFKSFLIRYGSKRWQLKLILKR